MKKLFNLVTLLVIIHSALYLSGCNPYKKQVERFHSFAYLHPEELAKDCAKLFPSKDSVSTGSETTSEDTESAFSEGEWQTLQPLAGDTIRIIKHDTLRITVTRTKTIRDTIFRTNTAQIDSLRNYGRSQELQVAKAQQLQVTTAQDRDDAKKTARTRLYILIAIAVGALGFAGFKLYSFFKPKL